MTRLASSLAIAALVAAPVLARAADTNPSSIGDPAKGKSAFVVCAACHQIGPNAKPLIGPPLNGIVGKKAASYPGFEYSSALKNANITWTVPELQKWLTAPAQLVPGTKMAFPGYPDTQTRDNVIAYLATFGPDGKQVGGK